MKSITDYLGKGKESAITRDDLCAAVGMTDRRMRKELELAQANGALIANEQDGSGYYIPTTERELLSAYKREYGRAMSVLVKLKFIRRELKRCGVNVR